MVAHSFNLRTLEAKEGGPGVPEASLATQGIPG